MDYIRLIVGSGNRILASHDFSQTDILQKYTFDNPDAREYILPIVDAPPIFTLDEFGAPWPTILDASIIETYMPPVPNVITSTQGKLALLDADLLDHVEAALDEISDTKEKRAAKLKFDAANWYRADPLFETLSAALEIEPAQFDEIWRAALAH